MAAELQTKASRLRAVAPKGKANEMQSDPINKSALEIAAHVCESKLIHLSTLPPEAVDANELYKIGNCLAGLTRATVETQRFELERMGAIHLAHELLVSEVQKLMTQNPELSAQLQAEITTAKGKLEQ